MFLASLILPAVLVAAPADPIRDAADKAALLVREGRYDDAIATLDEAERDGSQPVFVFMRGVVEDERGNCEGAITHYDRFLKLDVPEVDAKEARRRRDRCERFLATPPVGPTPAATETPSDPQPTPVDEAPPTRWYANPAGVTLTVIGVAGMATGAGLYVQAKADARAARRSTVLDVYHQRGTRAERLSRAGIATMAVAGGILVAAVVQYAIVAARHRRPKQRTAKRSFRSSPSP